MALHLKVSGQLSELRDLPKMYNDLTELNDPYYMFVKQKKRSPECLHQPTHMHCSHLTQTTYTVIERHNKWVAGMYRSLARRSPV
jgi:hypothetical protein